MTCRFCHGAGTLREKDELDGDPYTVPCRYCQPAVTVTHDGPPVVTPAPGQHVIVLDGLTPDEVRAITGLVRAMRRVGNVAQPHSDVEDCVDGALYCCDLGVRAMKRGSWSDVTITAAWHIAHAISQMGES